MSISQYLKGENCDTKKPYMFVSGHRSIRYKMSAPMVSNTKTSVKVVSAKKNPPKRIISKGE